MFDKLPHMPMYKYKDNVLLCKYNDNMLLCKYNYTFILMNAKKYTEKCNMQTARKISDYSQERRFTFDII